MATLFETCALRFSEAARMAAVLELYVRHLADFTPELRRHSLARRLEDVEDAVLHHFAPVLIKGEAEAVSAARGVRNKLLHCEFWTALARVEDTGASVHLPDVVMMKLETGEAKHAAETTADEPRIYSWMTLGAARGGLFEHAEHIFNDAIRVVKRLIVTPVH